MSTVIEDLMAGKELKRGAIVKLPIGKEATIYGFVAYHERLDDFPKDVKGINCPALGPAHVIGNRIVSALDGKLYRFPIFISVTKATKNKYPVFGLYNPELLLEAVYPSRATSYRRSMQSKTPDQFVYKNDGVKIEDNEAFYYPKEDELFFESSTSLKGIANAFVVITRRIAPDNEQVVYEVYSPDGIETKMV